MIAVKSVVEKPCSRCHQIKPASAFSPDKRATTGLQPDCKECSSAARRAKHAANPERLRANVRQWRLDNPERAKQIAKTSRSLNRDRVLQAKRDYYHRVKSTPEYQAKQRAHIATTKERKREYDRQRNLAHRESNAARVKLWTANNRDKRRVIVSAYDGRRRSAKRGGVSARELGAWIETQPKVCHWCSIDCSANFHVDHYVALSKGGEHETSNMVISCGPCNRRKNAKMPAAFALEIGRPDLAR